MEKKNNGPALSFLIPREMAQELKTVAERLEMKESEFARKAVASAIKAVKDANYQLVIPLRFSVTRVPQEHMTPQRIAKTGS